MATIVANWDEFPQGLVIGPMEALIRKDRFGKRRMVFWLTDQRIVVAERRGRRQHAVVTVPLSQCAAIRVERRKGFLHKDTVIAIHSAGGIAFQDEIPGKDSEKAAAFCAAVSNQLANLP